MKKLLCLLLAAVMLFSLAACGNGGDTPGNNDQPGNDQPGNEQPGGEQPGGEQPGGEQPGGEQPGGEQPGGEQPGGEDPATGGQTWPDGQVITWLVLDQSGTADSNRYDDLTAIKMIEEKFHVDIQFEVITGAENNQVDYLLRLTDDPLPDVIGYRNEEYYKGGIVGLYNNGLIIDLNDLIETKMPNLKALLEEYPDLAKQLSTNDGKYLYLQRLNTMSSAVDKVNLNNNGLIIRQQWLDEVNMDVPTNMEEWYEVLKAFKTQDPNGNGVDDEIPFNNYGSGIQLFMSAYGILPGIFINPETGKIDYGERTPQYKEYLEEMHKWYEEGLLDPSLGKDLSKADFESSIGIDQVGAWKASANNNTKGFMDTLREANPDASITACPCPATADGQHVYFNRNGVGPTRRESEVISVDAAKDPAKLDAIAAVMDYMLSEEGSLLLTWGEEGLTYTVDENGDRQLTEYAQEVEHLPSGQGVMMVQKYSVTSDYFPSVGCFDIDQATRDQWYRDACKLWNGADFALVWTGSISLTPEQTAELAEITGDNSELEAYIEDMNLKFIRGEEPLSNYDTYVDNLERMGIQKIVDIYQAAYDAFNAR